MPFAGCCSHHRPTPSVHTSRTQRASDTQALDSTCGSGVNLEPDHENALSAVLSWMLLRFVSDLEGECSGSVEGTALHYASGTGGDNFFAQSAGIHIMATGVELVKIRHRIGLDSHDTAMHECV